MCEHEVEYNFVAIHEAKTFGFFYQHDYYLLSTPCYQIQCTGGDASLTCSVADTVRYDANHPTAMAQVGYNFNAVSVAATAATATDSTNRISNARAG